ncbi:hypothetical protein [Marinicellulosiphila megalodicopiae]|uniref:hypothetical protein n=1 Tax=Marinicellulosiphila megalodicopiae TaxID=2724896 RepID=UPI003BB00A88
MIIVAPKVIAEINLSHSIYKSSLNSLISIYQDSERNREFRISEIHELIEKWSEDNQKLESEGYIPFCEETFDDLNHYQYHVDYLLMNSLFLSAFSMFENHMKRITNCFSSSEKNLIKPNDIKGSGEIDTFRKYIHLVINLDSANCDKHQWKNILSYKAIRNAVVHNSSILNKNKKTQLNKVIGYDLLKKHNIWFRGDILYFRLKNIDFLIDFIELTTQYTRNIIDEYQLKNKP